LQLVRRGAIYFDEKPAAQLLVERVVAIACCRLRNLREEGLHVQQHQAAQEVRAAKLFTQCGCAHAISEARALHLDARRHGFAASQNRHAGHAFTADCCDLYGTAVFHRMQQGDDGGGGEIHVMNTLSRIAQQLVGAKLNQFKMWRESLPFVCGKRTQQMIAVQVGLKSQHDVLLS